MSWASQMPLAATALVAACQAQIDLDGEVRDGPQVTNAQAREVITIGWATPEDDTVADGDFGQGDVGLASVEETFTLHNALAIQTGQIDVAGGRNRVFALLADVGAVVAKDRSLGKTVMSARMGPWTLREDTETGGYRAEIRFSVDCQAFTQR